MKQFLLCAVALCAGFMSAKAQDTLVTKNFPFTVSIKVKDIISVVPLTPQRQITLATFFKKELDQVQAAQQAESSDAVITQLKENLYLEFRSLLTMAELDQYTLVKKGSPYANPAIPVMTQQPGNPNGN